MGVSVSTNSAEQVNAVANDVAVTFSNTCKSSISQQTGLNLVDCNLTIQDGIDLNQVANVSVTCLQNSSFQSTMTDAISDAVSQKANSITQSLGGLSVSDANTVSSLSNLLAQSVVQKYTQTCVNGISSDNIINCKGSNITAGYIKTQNTVNDYNTCTQQDHGEAAIVSRMQDIINQTATATEENSFNALIGAGLLVIAVIAIFFVNSVSGNIGWIVVFIFFLLVIALVLYAFFAQRNGWYPFPQK